jgi:hypothetical protein
MVEIPVIMSVTISENNPFSLGMLMPLSWYMNVFYAFFKDSVDKEVLHQNDLSQ